MKHHLQNRKVKQKKYKKIKMPSQRILTTLQGKVVVPMVTVVGGVVKWWSLTMNKARANVSRRVGVVIIILFNPEGTL